MKVLRKLLNKYLPGHGCSVQRLSGFSPLLQHPASQVNILKMPLELKEPLPGNNSKLWIWVFALHWLLRNLSFCPIKWETGGGFPPLRGDGIFLNHKISSWEGEPMLSCVVEYPALRKDAREQGGESHTPQWPWGCNLQFCCF